MKKIEQVLGKQSVVILEIHFSGCQKGHPSQAFTTKTIALFNPCQHQALSLISIKNVKNAFLFVKSEAHKLMQCGK